MSLFTSIREHRNTAAVLKSMGWLLFQKVFVVLLGIFALGWVARHLGPATVGLLGNAAALVTYFGVFAIGIDATVFIKRLLDHPEREPAIMGGTTLVLFVTGFLSWLALVIWLWLGSNDSLLAKQVATLLGLRLCVVFPAPLAYWFQSRLKTKFTAIPQTTSALFLRGWQIACVLAGSSVVWIATGEVLALLVILVMSLWFYRQCGQRPGDWKYDWRGGLGILKSSLPALLASMLFTLLSRMDLLMLKNMLGIETAGYYTAATGLSESLFFMATLLSVPLAPLLVKAWKDSPAAYPSYRQNYAKLSALLGWGCAVALSLGSGIAVHVVFGESFRPSASVLALHAFMLVPCFMGAAMQNFLTIESLLLWLSGFFAIALVINFCLNLVLIPSYGMKGAVIASLTASLTAHTLAPLLFARTRHLGLTTIKALFWPLPDLKLLQRS